MKASLAVSKYFHKNKIFETGGRDNCNQRFLLLRDLLKGSGIELSTEDINPLNEKSKIHIHVDADLNKLKKSRESGAYSILIVSESPIICTANQDKKIREIPDKIFTWETDASEKNATWLGCGCSFESTPLSKSIAAFHKKKDLCMIIGNKLSNHNDELYSLRKKAINYFESSNISFDLYGNGWDRKTYQGLLRPLNKLAVARQWNFNEPKCYQGRVDSKSNTLAQYRFCLAFENAKSKNGYISEKIFDAMFASCIPIYAGSEDIGNVIPKNTFIDANKMSFKEILNTIEITTNDEYNARIQAIKQYTKEFMGSTFYFEPWARQIADDIVKYISNSF